MTALTLALCAVDAALMAIAVQVGRVADAVGRPRARAEKPAERPATSTGYPPPPDSTDAFYVPPTRNE